MTRKGKKKFSQPPPRRNPQEGSAHGPDEQASTSGVQSEQGAAAAGPAMLPPQGLTAALGAMDINAPQEKFQQQQQRQQQPPMPLRENVQAPSAPRGWGRGQGHGALAQKLPGATAPYAHPQPPLAGVAGMVQHMDSAPPASAPPAGAAGMAQHLDSAPPASVPPEAGKPHVLEAKFSVPPNKTVGVPRPDTLPAQGAPRLQANLYPLTINLKEVYHYDIEITRLWEERANNQQPKKTEPKKLSKPLPSALARKLFETAVKSDEKFFFTTLVFDGNRNAYTKVPLALNPGTTKIIQFGYTEVIGNQKKPGQFTMNITPATRQSEYEEFEKYSKRKKSQKSSMVQHVVDLELIDDFYKGTFKQIPQECLAAIGTILRHAPSLGTIPVRHGFYTRNQCTYLSGGLEVWHGYNFSVHVGRDRLYLNIDRGLATFYPEGSLLDYVAAVFGNKNPNVLKPPFFNNKKKHFVGIKFYMKHLEFAKHYSIWQLTDKDARQQTFDMNGRSIDVFSYYKKEHNINLKYPNLPLVVCGSATRQSYYPMELCYILENQPHYGQVSKDQQAILVKQSAIHPAERFKIIHNGLKSLKAISAKTLDYFGIQVGEQMLQVPSHQLKVPQLLFKNKTETPDLRGSWNAQGFYQGAALARWILISFVNLPEVNDLVQSIIKIGRDSFNMAINKPIVWEEKGDREEDVKRIFLKCKDLERTKNVNCQLIFVVLSDSINKAFLKCKGDYDFKIPTVCATWKNVQRQCMKKMFVGNLLLKINLKLQGVNYKLAPTSTPELMNNSIVFGVNITHSGPRDQNKSYAAVVANMDPTFNYYQEEITKPKSHEDILNDLRNMLCKLLCKYAQRMKAGPKRVVVFRDGVGEGQYPEILNNELPIVKQAYKMAFPTAGYEPLVSFAIGLRRNNMRFMPTTYKGNIPPGTVVDAASNPYEWEFYLCSHHGIQGTSCPTKYNVLHDDNRLKSQDFAQLIFCLSHLYPRCTRSISVPSVMRSAQHYAIRGKECSLWQSLDDDDEEEEEE